MATIAQRSGREETGRGRRLRPESGMWGVARIVSLITSVVVGLIVLAIILVLLEASRSNAIVDWLVGAGDWLSTPFHGIFSLDTHKATVAVNWGLAALVYGFVGGFIARLLRR